MPYAAVRASLSSPRLSTYDAVAARNGQDSIGAVELYEWNAELSSAFHTPLHLMEVVLRNAISDAISSVYSTNWPWNSSFTTSVPPIRGGFNPHRNLTRLASRHSTTGKLIAETKFAFWQHMLTRRYEPAIWSGQFAAAFPNHDPALTIRQALVALHDEIEHIRVFRNRVAHYEPIFGRPLHRDLTKIEAVVAMHSKDVHAWVESSHRVRDVLDAKPAWFNIQP